MIFDLPAGGRGSGLFRAATRRSTLELPTFLTNLMWDEFRDESRFRALSFPEPIFIKGGRASAFTGPWIGASPRLHSAIPPDENHQGATVRVVAARVKDAL